MSDSMTSDQPVCVGSIRYIGSDISEYEKEITVGAWNVMELNKVRSFGICLLNLVGEFVVNVGERESRRKC